LLGVDQADGQPGEHGGQRSQRRLEGLAQRARVGLGAGVKDELATADRGVQPLGQLGHKIAPHQAERGDFAVEAFVRAERHFEVGDFRPGQLSLHVARERLEHGLRRHGLRGLQADRGIEPAQTGLALGVGVIVHLRRRFRARGLLLEPLEPLGQAGALAHGHGQPRLAGESCSEPGEQALPPRRVQHIAFGEHHQVGLLELLVPDVAHLVGKRAPGAQAQHLLGPHRVHQHAQGRQAELSAVKAAQRVGDRGPQVGATAHRLGHESLRAGGGGELARGLEQRVEPATETAAGDFLGGEPAGAQPRGVHQPAALVVGDQAHALPASGQMPGQGRDGGGFTRAEEAADHVVPGRSVH
jgi:hypothetical protein